MLKKGGFLGIYWRFEWELWHYGICGNMWELFTGDLLNQWDFYWIEPPKILSEWELVVSIAIVWGPGGSKMSSISCFPSIRKFSKAVLNYIGHRATCPSWCFCILHSTGCLPGFPIRRGWPTQNSLGLPWFSSKTCSGWWFQPTPLKNDGGIVSWDHDIPNGHFKVISHSMGPNHQPDILTIDYISLT